MEPYTPPREIQNHPPSPASSSLSARLWRPTAQRNLRNQWSKLNSFRQDWHSAASAGRGHATGIVNSYLTQRYLDGMEFGALKDMPNIRTKARSKLFKQQERYKGKLLVAYKDLVDLVTRMVDACKSMRCYSRTICSGQLAQFSASSEDGNGSGDCGGIPVFTFRSVASFEKLAWEMVRMFISELGLKRLLVLELVSLYDEKAVGVPALKWSDEFYNGEFDNLRILNLYSEEIHEPVLPSFGNCVTGASVVSSKCQLDDKVLQVYITTWMVEVNIDRNRIDDMFAVVGAEMHVDFLETPC